MWKESLRSFRQSWPEWIKWAVVFALVFAVLEFFMLKEYGPYNAALLAIVKSQSSPQDMQAQLQALQKPNSLVMIAILALYFIQFYFFNVLFLRRKPIVAAPDPSLGGFFYMLGKLLLKYLLIYGWMLLFTIPLVLAGLLLKGQSKGAFLSFAMTGLLTFIGMVYFFMRYSMVFPLASEGLTSALKRSAQLTKGNIWRLIGNLIVLTLISSPLLGVSMAISWNVMGIPFWESVPETAVMAIIIASIGAVAGVLFSAYSCTTCHILYREKRQSDPSFTLTTRA